MFWAAARLAAMAAAFARALATLSAPAVGELTTMVAPTVTRDSRHRSARESGRRREWE